MPQNYSNHRKYYPPHHFIFYPVSAVVLVSLIRKAFTDPANEIIWYAMAVVTFLVIFLSLMLRQHYALGLQDRLVRMEVRFRYFVLTGKRFELLEDQLKFGQIAALRFASDEEFPALVQRAVSENLSPAEIKKQIRQWLPDLERV